MNKLFLPVITFILLLGCKKSSETQFHNIKVTVLDFDSRLPIAGAKVMLSRAANFLPKDSSLTDINGICIFQVTEVSGITLYPAKNGYLTDIGIGIAGPITNDHSITLYLLKPSFTKINLHRQAGYDNSDSVFIKLKGHFSRNIFNQDPFDSFYVRKANSVDTSLIVNCFYNNPSNTKIFFQWNIIRNGMIHSTQTDSADLIQYGIINYNLNY